MQTVVSPRAGHHTPRPKAKENTNVSQDGERLQPSQELHTVNLFPGVEGVNQQSDQAPLTHETHPEYQLLRRSADICDKEVWHEGRSGLPTTNFFSDCSSNSFEFLNINLYCMKTYDVSGFQTFGSLLAVEIIPPFPIDYSLTILEEKQAKLLWMGFSIIITFNWNRNRNKRHISLNSKLSWLTDSGGWT